MQINPPFCTYCFSVVQCKKHISSGRKGWFKALWNLFFYILGLEDFSKKPFYQGLVCKGNRSDIDLFSGQAVYIDNRPL